jgi:hypothetical protein
MAGLGPAIHETKVKSWMPGPSPGTNDFIYSRTDPP